MNKDSSFLDELDRNIIIELQKNGRISYKDMAKKFGVSDGTIRFRTKKLIEKNILKISALINPFIFNTSITALIGMKLEKRTHQNTMERLLKIKGVLSVTNITGNFDLFAEVFFESRKELNKFLIGDLSKIEGIQSTETFIYLDAKNKWIDMP